MRKILTLLLPLVLFFGGCGKKESVDEDKPTEEKQQKVKEEIKPIEPVADAKAKPDGVTKKELEEPSDTPKSLSDADVEGFLKEAVGEESLQYRDGLFYQNNEPYSGWAKGMYDSGQAKGLGQFKDGKQDGLEMRWHENGQKSYEATYKDGEQDGLRTRWHENGQKKAEINFKNGKPVEGSEKYWNSKGERVDSIEEAKAE